VSLSPALGANGEGEEDDILEAAVKCRGKRDSLARRGIQSCRRSEKESQHPAGPGWCGGEGRTQY
jgi:hypothetical protein